MSALPTTIDAIFEDGVFRPVTPISLPEHQRVRITLNLDRPMRDWPSNTAEIYRDLAEEDRRISAGMVDDIRASWPAPGDDAS